MVEFTLVVPVLIFGLLGVFEAALIMYSVGSARFAAADGARIVSEVGNQTLKCNDPKIPGCMKVYNNAAKNCDADCQAISAINLGPLGTTAIATVDELDVQRMVVNCANQVVNDTGSNGCNGTSVASCPCINAYKLDGTATPSTPPPAANPYPTQSGNGRNVTLGTADFASFTVKFHYVWKSGIFKQFAFPNLTTTYVVRLEPQKFPGS